MKTGQRVKAYLERTGVVKRALAAKLGISAQALNSMLKGNLRSDKVEEIARALNVSVASMLYDIDAASVDDMTGWVKLKVIGKVPAGVPIEAIEEYVGEIAVPPEHARPGCYALEVRGNSMVPKIMDGDVVVVAPCPDPYNGQVVVTRINSDGEVTLKKFQRDNGAILLVPENPEYQTRILTPDSNIKILGSVIALHRKF